MQRLIVAQIKQEGGGLNNDLYSGNVNYDNAPWVDWGPYLWASGDQPRNDGLVWCRGQGQGTLLCPLNQRDVRDGDILGDPDMYWGDYTHPSALGVQKVANQLVKFIKPVADGWSPFVQDWIGK